jgi:hypothetical protein
MKKVCIVFVLIISLLLTTDPYSQNINKTDAEPDYWTNLFSSTIRYTVQIEPNAFDIDVFFDRDGQLQSNTEYHGKWWVEGDEGSEMFCYTMISNIRQPSQLSECFLLLLMNNPRIGAKWPAAFKEGIMYEAVVIEGRP